MLLSKQKDYFWNTLAGIINAAEVIVLSMIVTRFGRLSDAGILSFAFAVANVLMAIGAFGGRMYQASDVKRQYTYSMYLVHRFFSLGLMAVVLIVFLGISAYEKEKVRAVVLITLIYMIEVVENCIWGHYQLADRLYIGARMFCTRWIAIFASFAICVVISHDMIKALLTGTIAGTAIFTVWVIWLIRSGDDRDRGIGRASHDTFDGNWFMSMTKNTFPLFVAGFCSLFINNVPKFAIDRYLNDDIQACYGFVAMPVFVIGLLNQFVYQPIVTKMSSEYNDGDLSRFKHNVNKQILMVAGISAACVVGAALIGIPVLSIIYDTDLNDYWKELVILQFAGGFLALTGFFNVVLTIMRKQKIILYGYIGATFLGALILAVSVKLAGTIGASVGYLIIMAILFGYYYLSYLRCFWTGSACDGL